MKALDGATAKEIIVKNERNIFYVNQFIFKMQIKLFLTSARFTRIVPCWPGSRFSKASEKQ